MPFGGATFRAPAQRAGQCHALPADRGRVRAAEALRIGLVQEVVPAGSHVQRALDIAKAAAQAPLECRRPWRTRSVARDGGPDAATEHLRAVLPGILEVSDDAAEGVTSFLEPPRAFHGSITAGTAAQAPGAGTAATITLAWYPPFAGSRQSAAADQRQPVASVQREQCGRVLAEC